MGRGSRGGWEGTWKGMDDGVDNEEGGRKGAVSDTPSTARQMSRWRQAARVR